jgi:ABC-type uncharacterized transport system substrate-binding protein
MRRREFLGVLGIAAALPVFAHAQQPERMRRIGVLWPFSAEDLRGKASLAALKQGLLQLGWTDGRNLRVDARWSTGELDDNRKNAAELVALAPDLIFASGSAAVGPLLQATRTIPIVFAIVPDPVGAGYVASLARPGGNATGFTSFDYGIGAKWLELLKQVVPALTRVAVIRDPSVTAGIGQWGAIQATAPSFRVELSPISVSDTAELENAIASFARGSNGGLIVTGSALAVVHRDLIVKLAARYKLPAVYYERYFVAAGGLVSYGPDYVDQYRQATTYIDRILKGEKPSDLPVQTPIKYELVINLQTAKALGLTMPPSVLAQANEVSNN